jgi:hypothetical protein
LGGTPRARPRLRRPRPPRFHAVAHPPTLHRPSPSFCLTPYPIGSAVPQAYKGEDKEILFCKDEDEVYSDEGFIIIVQPEDKEHFLAHIAAGNGIPPPVK